MSMLEQKRSEFWQHERIRLNLAVFETSRLESNVVCVAVKRSFGSANTRGRNYRRQTPDNMKKHLQEKHLLLDATRPKGDFSPPRVSCE